MRYDEIDLNGQLTIQGVIGGDRNLIQYSNGLVSWVTASVPTSIDTLVKNLGKNYILIESVSGDSIASGQKLIDAYTSISTELSNLNLSPTNRFTIFLTPGVYFLTSILVIDESYVDIVGLSSNPRSTKLRGSQNWIIELSGSDHILKNLELSQSTNCFYLNSTFVTCENLYISNTPFNVSHLRGYFKNIRVAEGIQFGNAELTMDAIFEDIYFEGGSGTTFTVGTNGMIQGTFSNITVENLVSPCFYHSSPSNYDVKINLYNFKILAGSSTFFYLGGTVSGTFENLDITTTGTCFFSERGLISNWKNVKLQSDHVAPDVFNFNYFDSTFENIEMNVSSMFINSIFKVNKFFRGTFSNINISVGQSYQLFVANDSNSYFNLNVKDFSVSGDYQYVFTTPTGCTLSGNFTNIELNGNSNYCFTSVNRDIVGSFDNILISGCVYNAFQSGGSLTGKYSNIKLTSTKNTGNHFNADSIVGDFNDIKVTNFPGEISPSVFGSNNHLYGTFKNLEVTSSSIMTAVATISCVIEDSIFDTTALFVSSGNIIGTYSNIIIQNTTINSSFYSSGGYIDVSINGVYFNDVAEKLFHALGSIKGKYKRIRIGDQTALSNHNLFSAYLIDGEFSDIICGSSSFGNRIFVSATDLRGTYSDIRIGQYWDGIFESSSEISGNFRDLYISPTLQNYSFIATSMASSTLFDNVKNYNLLGVPFTGRMFNCVIAPETVTFNEGDYFAFEIVDPVLIENTDFYCWGSQELTVAETQNWFSASIWERDNNQLDDVHILKCGISHGFPLSVYGVDNTNFGINPLLGSGAYNVLNIPKPK